jgi:hypothetical protein
LCHWALCSSSDGAAPQLFASHHGLNARIEEWNAGLLP